MRVRRVRRRGSALWATAVVLLVVVAGTLVGCARRLAPSAPPLSIESAVATNQTTVVVAFDRNVGDGAADGSRYRIAEPDGELLTVLAAYPDADGTTVRLATEPQQLVTYALEVVDLGSAAAGAQTQTVRLDGGFPGSDVAAPVLSSAVALTNRQVLLTFRDPVTGTLAPMGAGADDPMHYTISGTALEVAGAVFADMGKDKARVILTTEPMTNARYRVELVNARTAAGDQLLDPFLDNAEFRGMGNPDTVPPDLLGAEVLDGTTVFLAFSEPLASEAKQPVHYSVADGDGRDLTVTAATLEPFATGVTLTTWPMTGGVTYTATVQGVHDTHGNAIGQPTASFTAPAEGGGPDNTPPRVLSANATSNSSVVVTFSEPVAGGSYSAENPANYAIQDAPAGALTTQAVLTVKKAVLSANKRTVTLTTLSQSEIEYALKVTDVKDLAGNQVVPPDRDNPYQVTFRGAGAGGAAVDSDGDGLSDAAEQLGWTVTVTTADGTQKKSTVTSDPGDPSRSASDPINVAARDTDQDGIPDADEKAYRTNPRSADTDGDQLTDEAELNHVYSDPTMQDTDGDSLTDGLEFNFFHTSALFADTDGDGLTDDYEIATANRNPRLADLPRPQIKIGSVDLALDVRFETESQKGSNAVDSKSSQVTLQQDQSTTTSTTDTSTNEWFFKAGAKLGFEVSVGFKDPGTKYSGEFSTEGGVSGSSTFEVSNESARASSKGYADTLSTENSFSRQETLTRRVDAAQIGVLVDVENLGNLAFTMTDLEITALVKDARDPRILTPVATLFPADPSLSINLGPLDSTTRGPFRFVANDAFPARVEDLMSNPRGIVFKVANFTIRDEEGNSFSFGEQAVNDRTAPLVIDYGVKAIGTGRRGAVESYRVATNSDFDADGHPNGVTVAQALEDILGLTYYREETTPTSSLTAQQIANSYSTFDTINGVPRIWRVRSAMPSTSLAAVKSGTVIHEGWQVLLSDGIDTSVNVRDFVLRPENGLTLAYVQDMDQDGVPARVELYYGSSDDPAAVADAHDSDGDQVAAPNDPNSNLDLSDNFEIYGGWSVRVNRATGDAIEEDVFDVRSSPARADTDADGLTDWEEMHGCLDRKPPVQECDPGTGFGTSVNGAGVVSHFAAPTDPTSADTDGDRVLDATEVMGFNVTPTLGPAAYVRTDPTDVDTDNDGVADGDERLFGGNPALADTASFTDTDGDGLLDQVELDGWTVSYRQVATVVGNAGPMATRHVTSNPDFGMLDTDGDGLSDGEEYALKTDPSSADTDGDGISDYDEVKGARTLPFDGNPRVTNPLDADTDHDTLSDGAEINPASGWLVTLGGVSHKVYSDPTATDLDGDGLTDDVEKAHGIDPNAADTDGDGATDKVELARSADGDADNDTDPLTPDQVLKLKVEAKGELTGALYCGSAEGVWLYGNPGFQVNGTVNAPYWTTGSNNLKSAFVTAYDKTVVFEASPNGIAAILQTLKHSVGGIEYTFAGLPTANGVNVFRPDGTGNMYATSSTKSWTLEEVGGSSGTCKITLQYTVAPQP